MRGVLLGILIFLLCSAVFVGALNNIPDSPFNNRPYTLYEFVQEVSQLNFGIDNVTEMIEQVRVVWSDADIGDEISKRDKNGNGKLEADEVDLNGNGNFDPDEVDLNGNGFFGYLEYGIVYSGKDISTLFNGDLLKGIYNILLTLYELVAFVFNFVFDIFKLVADILQLALNFIIGKPLAA